MYCRGHFLRNKECPFVLLGHLPYFAIRVSQQRNVAKQKNKTTCYASGWDSLSVMSDKLLCYNNSGSPTALNSKGGYPYGQQ